MSAWTCRSFDGKAAVKIVPPRPRIPWWKGLGADSEEKREPVSDIDTAAADSLKMLDPKRPIREADIPLSSSRRPVRAARLRCSYVKGFITAWRPIGFSITGHGVRLCVDVPRGRWALR